MKLPCDECMFIVAIYGLLILAAVLFGNIVFGWGTAHTDHKPTEKGCNWSSLKKYAESVDDMKCKGDDINLGKVLDMPGINSKQEKCIKHRADLGNELYENEIMHCYLRND